MARRGSADKAKIDAIEEKLLANPEIAKLFDGLGTSPTDADHSRERSGPQQGEGNHGCQGEVGTVIGVRPVERS
ncbi:hypothetical protein [Corynebacterium phoceense]